MKLIIISISCDVRKELHELIYYTVCSVSTTTMHRVGAGCWTLTCRPAQVLLGSC